MPARPLCRTHAKGAAAAAKKPASSSKHASHGTAAAKAPVASSGRHVAASRAATHGVSSKPAAKMGSAKMDALAKEVESLKLAVERTEQEREFYFEKLQDVEFLCQRPEFIGQHLTKVVEKVLYFTEGKPDVDAIIAECAAESTGSVVTPTEAGVPPVDTEAAGGGAATLEDGAAPFLDELREDARRHSLAEPGSLLLPSPSGQLVEVRRSLQQLVVEGFKLVGKPGQEGV